jgi:secreted trypsin-like serine protease
MTEIVNMKFLILFILLTIVHGFDERKTSGRIFDGSEAPEHGFPWMAAIYFYDPAPQFNRTYHVCGGSIVSDMYVITAASCFFNVHQNFFFLFSVKAGIHKSFNGSEETEQIRSVSRIVVHPNYNNATYLNDLALVRVSTAFNLKALYVQTVSLSNLSSVEGMDLVTIGWGLYNRSNLTVAATSLQQVTVQEDVNCTENKMINSTTQLCATGKIYFLNYIYCSMNINRFFSSRNLYTYVSRSFFNITYYLRFLFLS